uniref:Uncharacterized protein n=1 Tax=Rhizophora mucronata TaxID=61149 RepID=A0A2P2P4K4_RHIMU
MQAAHWQFHPEPLNSKLPSPLATD